MAKSLAKINEQIAKLQKEAHSIQSTVIARIKREIAQHGLTADHLFGSSGTAPNSTGGKSAAKRGASATKGSAKAAKYADDQGNAWHGVGKRPQWIHDALNAGRELADFLVGNKKPSAKASPRGGDAPTKVANAVKATRKTAKAASPKATPAKKAVAAKPGPRSAAAPVAAKRPAKSRTPATARKVPAKKSPKAKAAATTSASTDTAAPQA